MTCDRLLATLSRREREDRSLGGFETVPRPSERNAWGHGGETAKRASTTLARGALVLLIAVLGCGRPPAPPSPASVVSPDEKHLLAIEAYEPMYQMDAEGRVIRVRMTRCHVPTVAMAEIGKMTEIVQLDFYGSTVNDEGLEQLVGLKNLRQLGLGETLITDKGLVHLERLDGLNWVWLPMNRISKQAIDKLKAARPDLNVG